MKPTSEARARLFLYTYFFLVAGYAVFDYFLVYRIEKQITLADVTNEVGRFALFWGCLFALVAWWNAKREDPLGRDIERDPQNSDDPNYVPKRRNLRMIGAGAILGLVAIPAALLAFLMSAVAVVPGLFMLNPYEVRGSGQFAFWAATTSFVSFWISNKLWRRK